MGSKGVPVGVNIIDPRFGDAQALAAAHFCNYVCLRGLNINDVELMRSRTYAEQESTRVHGERQRTALADLARFGSREDGGIARETLTPLDLQARRYPIQRAHLAM